MKKSLLMLSLAVSAFVAPVATSAAVNSELVGKAMTIGEAVTEITPGNWYLLNNVGRSNYVKEETSAYKMRNRPTSTLASENAGYLFKITNSTTEGKYNIQSGNGLYFALGNDNSSVSQTARDFDIQKIGSAADRFYMQDVESRYIADGQGTGDNFVGWGQAIPTNTGGNSAYRFIAVSFTDLVDVTYTFPTPDGNHTFTRTVTLAVGATAADHIPAMGCFTSTGLQGTATTVSETAKTFTVNGSWNIPISANTVYRLALKPSANTDKVVSVNEAGTDISTNVATTTTLSTTALWYFKSAEYDTEGWPKYTLHSLMDGTKGVTMENIDHATATLSENPTVFAFAPSTAGQPQDKNFRLKIAGTPNGFVNDRDQKFSTWLADVSDDDGSVLRVYSLTEDDFAAMAITSTEAEINNAKTNPTPEVIKPLVNTRSPLAMAIVAAEAFEGTIGTGFGQYNNAANNFATNLADAKALVNDATASEDDINAAIAAIAVSDLHIIQPKAGHFYRFHYGDKYLSSTLHTVGTNDERFSIVTKTTDAQGNNDLNNTSVFYYDGTRLVTYPEGLVLGNLSTNVNHKKDGSMRGVIKDSALDGNSLEFTTSLEEIDKYNIKVNGDRYLFHDANNIDSGGGNNDPYGRNGYRWEIEEVTWLPVPVDVNKKHFSVCVPVDLNITANRAEPHTGVIQGSNFGLQAIEGTTEGVTLPANTPAVLEYKDGAANNCVYFQITGYPEVATAAATTSDLKNTDVYATPTHDEGQSYFTVDHESFVPHTSGNLPAFAAILKVSTDQVPAFEEGKTGYTITEYKEPVSITEIEGAGNNGKQVIYDLQGRRVQRASKGLYIINGVKTLVK